MKLVRPSFQIFDDIEGLEVLKKIERAGRTCYKSEAEITDTSAENFVRNIIKRGHESVLEHEKISVLIVCDRGVSHEIVRHRIASYSQESTRYCDYEKGHVTFIIPPWVDVDPKVYNFEYDSELEDIICLDFISEDKASYEWFWSCAQSEESYKKLRNLGWEPQQARSVLSNSLKTEIVVTMNLREWRHFFKLRTAPAAHPQMREISIPLLEKFKELIQVVFEDITHE